MQENRPIIALDFASKAQIEQFLAKFPAGRITICENWNGTILSRRPSDCPIFKRTRS